ncbi:MAG TPA: prolyl oligopeptidase family serine peptidase [Rhodanobacteraceae bacterium]|nr:prolyl oligopeptidase family serine peptidase [Rhodanobacteraceae bacterium]
MRLALVAVLASVAVNATEPPPTPGLAPKAAAQALIAPAARVPQAPATARGDDASVIHDVRVADPYRWLEDGASVKVKDWIAAQNHHTEQFLDTIKDREAINQRVQALAITSTTRSSPLLAGGTLFYLQETPPQPQPVLIAQKWPDGKARVLVDLNGAGGSTAITGYWPSPSGRYLAYGTAEGGSELTTIHVLDVKTGKPLRDALPWAGGGTTPQGLAWDATERGFVYVRFPPPPKGEDVKQFNAALAHHLLGQPAATDTVVFGKDYSRIAEYRLLESADARTLAVLANAGDGGPADVYLREGTRWHKVLGAEADVRGAAWSGQTLLVESFAGADRGKLLAVDAKGKVSTVLEQRAGAIQGVAPVGKGFLVTYSNGPDWWIEQFDAGGEFVRRLPLPGSGIGIGGIASEVGQDKALIAWSGWSLPSRWSEYDAAKGTLSTRFEVKPAADYSKVVAERIDGVSKDGTRIPVTVLSLKGVTPNGQRPTILYSYGGFDNPIRPGFLGAKLAWLEQGGVYAVANIRGGNEDGQAWHRGGQKRDKQNVFDDFYAAGQALVTAGWTDNLHLGIMGGSNGGLLMGAEIVQHPSAWRAVVAMVGIYDMLRHETEFANGAYNVPEYGSITDATQFKATLAYSPLQNVKDKTAYPAVLMTTGVNDSRVAPWQSRKFAAALQAATSSGQPILLLTRMNAGHGIGAPFAQRVGNTAIALSFFAQELGLPQKSP